MAGTGERFESELPKQYHLLADKRVYLHTLERFLEVEQFTEILLVCENSWCKEVSREVSSYQKVRVVAGGATRQDSSFLGLIAAGSDTHFVVIHDAVRPFVSKEILLANIKAVQLHGAIDTCISSADTLVYAPGGDCITAIPNRTDYLRGQTPQSFSYPLILEAHKQANKQGIKTRSDDCSLALSLGAKIAIVRGGEENFKITTAYDLKRAEALLGVSAIQT